MLSIVTGGLTLVLPLGAGMVLLQIQYPDALPTMSLDLSNIRLFAAYLAK